MRYLQSAGAVATLCTLVLASPRAGAATVFDFEAYGDLDPVTSLIVGVDLSNAVAMVAGQSLNELDFPPRSGTTVVIDTGGPIAIDFAVPVVSVGAWFTYVTGLTLTAFDAAFNVLGTDLSQFGANGATAGDPGSAPNEWLGFVSSTDIRRVTISGDPAGGSFVMDDLTLEYGRNGGVPEPPVLPLLAAGAVALGSVRPRARRRRTG